MAGTVRDFKNYTLRLAGCRAHFAFCAKSAEHLAFWEKLNRIGVRNINVQPAQFCPDIDATVQLTDKEWEALKIELQGIIAPTMFAR